LFFELNPSSFPDDEKKIVFILSLLSGKACEWKEARFPSESAITCTFEEFLNEFTLVFSSKSVESHGLSNIKQGNRSVKHFSEDFRVRAAASGWSDAMLKSIYIKALNKEIGNKLATLDKSATLEELIHTALYHEHRLKPRSRKPVQPSLVQFSPVQFSSVQPCSVHYRTVLSSSAITYMTAS